ncbi:MAG: PadR family transcriptional regulator, partial [Acidobacteriota bacterium]
SGSSGLDRQFVKGGATTVILAILCDQPMHGYELIRTIRDRSQGILDFSDGTVYPLLYNLRDKGLIASRAATSTSGRRRKIYEITEAGRTILAQKLEDWTLFSRGMELALGRVK